jgi:16S rRNA (uracil1498-N3)-methyltransferase
MHRFKIDGGDPPGDLITLTGEEYRHLANVLRVKTGEDVIVFDDKGMEYFCTVLGFDDRAAMLRVIRQAPGAAEPGIWTTLYQAIPKGDKMEMVIQKAVELGVKEIYPVAAIRSITKLDGKKQIDRVSRWNRIAKEAAKQCGRSYIPQVHHPVGFREAVDKAVSSSFCIFPYENAVETGMSDLDIEGKERFSIFIGSEGGFDDTEVAYVCSKGIIPITLGKRY